MASYTINLIKTMVSYTREHCYDMGMGVLLVFIVYVTYVYDIYTI